MIDVLLSTEDVTVLGPPQYIDVSVDIGPTGVRGSQIFIGSGDPNDTNTVIGQTPIYNDVYINAAPGTDYGYLYQYIKDPANPDTGVWQTSLKLNPVIYNAVTDVTFTAGAATITIPISNITSSNTLALTADKFSVQYSIVGDNPIASSMTIPTVTNGNFKINLKAMENASGTWQNIAGDFAVHLLISVIMV